MNKQKIIELVIIVLKQCYPKHWLTLLITLFNFHYRQLNVMGLLTDIKYFT